MKLYLDAGFQHFALFAFCQQNITFKIKDIIGLHVFVLV